MNPKPSTKQPERLVNLRVPTDLHERFREVAAKRERTVSQELRWLMQQRIADADEQAEPTEAVA